jgi:heat shock protein HtpX
VSRIAARIVMAAVGTVLFVLYAGGALLALWALSALWNEFVHPVVFVVGAVAFGAVLAYLSYRYGTRRLLGRLDAVEVAPARAPELYRRLDRLCRAMGIERPRVVVTRMETPNAFAVGGGRGVLVLDQHLLALLETDELEAILAHELAHVESRDALVATMAYSTLRSLVGVTLVVLFPFLLLVTGTAKAVGWIRGRPTEWERTLPGRLRGRIEGVVAVVASAITLLFLAHSRKREFAADDRAVEVTGKPLALARGLAKIHRASGSPWDLLAMLRVTGRDDEGKLRELLSTHPPIDDRIDRLLERVRGDAAVRTDPLRTPVE